MSSLGNVNNSINIVSILISALENGNGLKYRILAEKIAEMIRSGEFAPGKKLPTHRQLSYELGVTPGTVSKAYSELARIGLVSGRVGGGTFVLGEAENTDKASFRTYSEIGPEVIDMSLNIAIPTGLTPLYRSTFEDILGDPASMENMQRYAPEVGYAAYRAAGATWVSYNQFQAVPEQVVCTNGAQHGLFCSLLALVKPGDMIATEQFTYPGLISACRALGVKLVGIEMDEEGLIPEALETACRLYTFSALYCTPTLQNPTTASMSAERLEKIVQICLSNGIVMIEDQTHAVLVERRPPPLASFAPEHAIILSSLSKAVSSGLRVGFVHAPRRLISRISTMVRSTCWMITPLSFELAARWIASGEAKMILQRQREEIYRRKALVSELMKPLRHWTHPDSPHYWIETAEPWRTSEICTQLKQKGVNIASVESFAVDRVRGGQFIRASVSLIESDDALLLRGFETLSQIVTDPEAADMLP